MENNYNIVKDILNKEKLNKENKLDNIDSTNIEYKKINHILNIYKTELKNYKYIEYNTINTIPINGYICYINKNFYKKKNAILISIIDNSIFKLTNYSKKRIWYIYINKYFIFYKDKNISKLKSILQEMVDTDFTDLTFLKIDK
jgi:hypothetical protein